MGGADANLSSGREKALEAESAMPGLSEEPEVVQHGWSITSIRTGEITGKED